MSFTAINTPLIALFSLAYGLGHPDVAAFRPVLVDKTLSSFHEDLNRTAKELQVGAQRMIDIRGLVSTASALTSPQPSQQNLMPIRQNGQVANLPGIERSNAGFSQVSFQKQAMGIVDRKAGEGFTALQAR